MSDIVERLHKFGTVSPDGNLRGPALEAADEILRLRKDLEDTKADYLRRHEDATDRYLEIERLRTLLSEAEQRARREALNDASKFIEDFVVTSTNRGPLVKPRDGNVYAIHYAEKIRCL